MRGIKACDATHRVKSLISGLSRAPSKRSPGANAAPRARANLMDGGDRPLVSDPEVDRLRGPPERLHRPRGLLRSVGEHDKAKKIGTLADTAAPKAGLHSTGALQRPPPRDLAPPRRARSATAVGPPAISFTSHQSLSFTSHQSLCSSYPSPVLGKCDAPPCRAAALPQ